MNSTIRFFAYGASASISLALFVFMIGDTADISFASIFSLFYVAFNFCLAMYCLIKDNSLAIWKNEEKKLEKKKSDTKQELKPVSKENLRYAKIIEKERAEKEKIQNDIFADNLFCVQQNVCPECGELAIRRTTTTGRVGYTVHYKCMKCNFELHNERCII